MVARSLYSWYPNFDVVVFVKRSVVFFRFLCRVCRGKLVHRPVVDVLLFTYILGGPIQSAQGSVVSNRMQAEDGNYKCE